MGPYGFVGVSPSGGARRRSAVVAERLAEVNVDLAGPAAELCYFDRHTFAEDLKAIVGRPPNWYR
jgi:hypothetical protein